MFATMNEVQELVTSRLGSKTRVVFASSPGYASLPCFTVRLRHVSLIFLKMEVAAAWADVSHALRGFYELADILIVLDEVLCLEVSNLARQLKFTRKWGLTIL